MFLILAGAFAASAALAQSVQKFPFSKTPAGEAVDLYKIKNAAGAELDVITYGAIITRLTAPDSKGNYADVVLGFNDIEGYIKGGAYFGAAVGRYGNRIGGAKFALNGKEYSLYKNDGENTLHGGKAGFDKKIWTARPIKGQGWTGVELSLTSGDGDEGYPGKLKLKLTYKLNNDNELEIDYLAESDADTPYNATQHSYFNLKGEGEGDILAHKILINADFFTPVDAALIPTGEILSVKNTPFDFTEPAAIGARIEANDAQLKYGKGYDHNFVLAKPDGEFGLAARVYEPASGRIMEVWTTEPGIQFYCGNFLTGKDVGKTGKPYIHRGAIALETQHYPDSPNKPHFPSAILKAGKPYASKTVYKFKTAQ